MYSTYLTLLVPAIIAFIITVIATLFLINYMRESGITSLDHYKKNKPRIPGGGGVALAFGFTVGMLVYIFGGSFGLYIPVADYTYLFATVLAVLLISFGGFLDDLNVHPVKTKSTGMMDYRKGLKQWQKPLLTLIGAIPLMAVNAGISIVHIPLIGAVNFGVFYPLLIIPLAILYASNAFNLLGGFDGLSAGSAVIVSLALLIYSLSFGTYSGTLVSALLLSSSLAFLIFNIYPAKIHPGDSFTYAIGAGFIAAIVIGNMEAFGFIIFLPWLIEFLLHLRRKFDVTDLGKMRSDGTMEPPYGKKIYSWAHLIMNMKRCKEWEVSLYMWLIEIGFVLLAFGIVLAPSL